jgi:LmbE family N-acetylglucosaminyl deacetylase
MEWVFLSPHFDDAALSCGGLVWELGQAGHPVQVWTICAGEQPSGELSPFAQALHARWQAGAEAVTRRKAEDLRSCAVMGAAPLHFSIPDCIYRITGNPHYPSEESLFGPLHPAEEDLVSSLSEELAGALPVEAEMVCPLSIGGHVDHRLTRAAAEKIGNRSWYYADYPYTLKRREEVARLEQKGWEATCFPVSENGLRAWEAAVAAHASQISSFWESLEEMRSDLYAYIQAEGGIRLWRRPKEHLF